MPLRLVVPSALLLCAASALAQTPEQPAPAPAATEAPAAAPSPGPEGPSAAPAGTPAPESTVREEAKPTADSVPPDAEEERKRLLKEKRARSLAVLEFAT